MFAPDLSTLTMYRTAGCSGDRVAPEAGGRADIGIELRRRKPTALAINNKDGLNEAEAKRTNPRKFIVSEGFVCLNSAPTRIRTLDLLIKSQLLYQLSYRSSFVRRNDIGDNSLCKGFGHKS